MVTDAEIESSTGEMDGPTRLSPTSGVGAGLLVALIAFAWSWHPSLWSDEAATIGAATRSLPDLVATLGSIDVVHGFYYLIMHGWIDLFGASATSIRLPSTIAVGVAGACLFWLAERFRGPELAWYAVGVFALLPRITWAGVEARAYGFTAAFAAAATLLLVLGLDSDRRGAATWCWIGYILLVIGGILSNLYVGLLLPAHFAAVLWDRTVTRRQRVTWLVAAGAVVMLAAPFMLAAYQQAGQLSDRSIGLRDVIQNAAVNQLFLGDTPTNTTGAGRTGFAVGDIGTWWLPASLILAAGCWLLVILAVVTHRDELRGRIDRPGRPVLVWMLPWVIIPPVVIGAYSVLVTPMFSPRYVTFTAPAAAILIAVGLTCLVKRWLRATACVLLVLLVIPIYVSQRQLGGKNGTDWRSVAEYIGANATAGDGVYFAPRYDVERTTVGQTTRGISVAYPDAFAGLVDLTLIRSAAQAHNMVGESRYLAQSTAELAAVDTVWVIRRLDYPPDDAAADELLLASAGFERTGAWVGPLDTVIRFDRTNGP